MSARVELSFRCSSREACQELGRVLGPDNVNLPRGLVIRMTTVDTTVRFAIGSDTLPNALSTAMAVFRDVTLFMQIWLLSRAPEG